ncbi:unnamed protein product [Prunus armeniaca]|uniref:Uncharacterized protein n=1 Tax=Prunus armeniaca TaxID=36596 RepID=A0A6J5WYA3_PRUAR|nr:unnamed protein product [Prunus armeniaca]
MKITLRIVPCTITEEERPQGRYGDVPRQRREEKGQKGTKERSKFWTCKMRGGRGSSPIDSSDVVWSS